MIAAAGNTLLPVVQGRCSASRSSVHLTTAACSFYSHLSPPLRSLPWVGITSLRGSVRRAKFEGFDGTEGLGTAEDDDEATTPSVEGLLEGEDDYEEEEDSDLPCDLEDSIRQSARASALFVSSGGMRAIVELLIPQLQFLDSEGAQEELWGLTRIFVDTIIQETGGNQRVKAIFPDTGAAALLQYQWKDAEFGFASLSDRKPVEDGDDIVVMLVPDYQMLEYVEKIASRLSDDPPRSLIMWNPRLVSEDVGVGFNVRNLRKYFLSTFTTVYSMRPMPSGAIFRCYPGMWKVFYDDKDRPNRYRLAKEQASRPDATDLEQIFGEIAEKSEGKPSMFDKALGMISSMNRFMKAISK
ncbi:unnamed protein product [Spirodela intermedia]|uniref:DUF1995 domain-containing protein n=1 Tax=Spirodela intermedia TaxID=51605 RepID=A0A7I8K2L3_SPIIN|nr:unnamed protein product [Spirodela intermedia]